MQPTWVWSKIQHWVPWVPAGVILGADIESILSTDRCACQKKKKTMKKLKPLIRIVLTKHPM